MPFANVLRPLANRAQRFASEIQESVCVECIVCGILHLLRALNRMRHPVGSSVLDVMTSSGKGCYRQILAAMQAEARSDCAAAMLPERR